jgi:Arc/MetJ family transcription regulator
MATNLDLDPAVVERVLAASGERTKKAAVTKAFQEYVARLEPRSILELFGSLSWDPDFDYKKERSRG